MIPIRRLLLVSLLSTSALAVPTQNEYFRDATPAERAMTGVPGSPGAPAAILHTSRHQDDAENYASEYMRIKVFTDDGKKYADVELPYVPNEYEVKDLRARTIHPDGKVVAWDGKLFEKLIVKKGRRRVMAKTFTLPDVTPGSILEYRYVRTWPKEQLRNSVWIPQARIPIVKADLWLKPYARDYSSFFSISGLPSGKVPVKVGSHYELTLENVPAPVEEPFAPNAEQLQPYVAYQYIVGAPNAEEYWSNAGKKFAEDAEDFIGKNRPVVARVTKEVTAGAASKDAMLRKIYARMQQLRNRTYEDEKTEQEQKREKLEENHTADDVLTNGYGTRTDITRTFVAMVRAAGMYASIVRVGHRDDPPFTKVLPDSSQLGYEIAVVDEGLSLCYDPGTPGAPFGIISSEFMHIQGLRLVRKTPGNWVETPNLGAGSAVTRREADLRLENDVVKGTVTIAFEGQEALQRRLDHRGDDETAARKKIEEAIRGWLPEGSTTRLTSLTGLADYDAPVVAKLEVEMPNLGSVAGSRAMLPLAIFSVREKNPFAAEQRTNPVVFPYPFKTQDLVRLQLPAGYAIETLPQQETINLGGAVYSAHWWDKGSSISFHRTFTMATWETPVTGYPLLRTFYGKVAAHDQQMVLLRKR